MFNRIGIYERFASCHSFERPTELAEILGVTRQIVNHWKSGFRPIPWHRLRTLVDEQGISWDWLIEGKRPKHHRHGKDTACRPFDRHAINHRFLSLFPDMSQAGLARELGVKQMSVYRWCHDKAQVPWERLKYAVDTKGATWEWLIEGR